MNHPVKQQLKTSRARWSNKELRAILSVLNKFGHEDIEKFAEVIPNRSVSEIRRYLNFFEKSAKKRSNTHKCNRDVIQKIHPWLPLVYTRENDESKICDNLVAFLLPFMKTCSILKNEENFNGINFSLAYEAIFHSLTSDKFPKNINKETVAMIYASLHQLFRSTNRVSCSEKIILEECLTNNSDNALKLREENCTIILPELNALNLTLEQVNILCQPKI